MRYLIKKNAEPIYLQLYKQLREDIVSGAYAYGSKLPSKRILSEEMGVSVITIEHAYGLLCEEGYAEARSRSGYYVIYKEGDFLLHGAQEERLMPVFETCPEVYGTEFPFSVMAKAMRKVVSDYAEALLQKSHHKGCLPLRREICNYLRRSVGISADPEQVVVGAGAEYLYSLALQLLGKDKIYGLENPSYEKIRQVYNANGISFELLDLGNNGIKTEQLRSTAAKVLHITPYNSYPSLVTASAGKRREYLQWARERKGYIIEDNYDSELTVSKKHEETLFSLSEDSNVIYINTFSRTISPAIRVGYMILPPDLIGEFDRKLGFYACTVPSFEQYLLAELIAGGEFERHINRVRRNKRKNQN